MGCGGFGILNENCVCSLGYECGFIRRGLVISCGGSNVGYFVSYVGDYGVSGCDSVDSCGNSNIVDSCCSSSNFVDSCGNSGDCSNSGCCGLR